MTDDTPQTPSKRDTKSLSDGDIVTGRRFGRRSLLATAGVGLVGGAALLGGARPALAGPTDSDTGANADPAGSGRGYVRGRPSTQTDSDEGPDADPAGNGRGGAGQRRNAVTDSDSGANADPAGSGRGPSRAAASGATDNDAGAMADPAGDGRNVR